MIDRPTGFGILSLVTFLPLLGALLMLCVPATFPKVCKALALGVTAVTFVLSILVVLAFRPATYHFQLVEFIPWIYDLGIHYRVGIDGISVWLVALTTFLTLVSTAFSLYVDHRVKAYMIAVLILETAMLGVFVSLDLVLFYTFFEASLVPMALLIWIWGGERRSYAALKFFIYTFAASIFMLIGIIVLQQQYLKATGVSSFSLLDIQAAVARGQLWAGALQLQALVFWAFAVAFLVKCPMFPFHTWLPDAHTEAPTAGSILLAGVLLKMGTYGFLRFCLPLFPDVVRAQVVPIMVLAVIGIIYGAIVAAMQPDVKRLVAYSSVAHMGFVMFGIFSLTNSGLMGGAYQQLNHGISTGALFLLIGLLYERRHTRMFSEFGGLKAQMPVFAALFLIVMLSSVGLPSMNGFVGEFLGLLGGFEASYARAFGLNIWFPVIAGIGVILSAAYLLWMFQKLFYGPNANPANRRLRDIKPWETVLVGSLVVFVFWGGIWPNTFLKPMAASVEATRMMALNDVSGRPVWSDLTMELDSAMNLVYIGSRGQDSVGLSYTAGDPNLTVLAPAQLHFPAQPGPMPPRRRFSEAWPSARVEF